MSLSKTLGLEALIVLGFCLRITFVLFSNHIYHPDEIYQSLEPSLRLIKGYGYIPWDIAHGLRSSWIVGFTAIPLFLLSLFPSVSPSLVIMATKIWLVIFSLALIPAGYYLMFHLTRNHRLSLLAAFCLAIWYEIVYFAARAFTEVIAVDLLSLSLITWYGPKRHTGLTAFLVLLGALVRIQYFVAIIPILWAMLRVSKKIPVLVGSLTALVLFGLCDYLTQGVFLGSLFNNVRLSYISGISVVFGTKPVSFYLWSILGCSAGLSLLAIMQIRHKKFLGLSAVWIILLCLHFSIPHKEYRFLFLTIPIMILLSSSWLFIRWSKHVSLIYLLFVTFSILGFTQKLPFQVLAYPQPLFLRDPYLDLLSILSQNHSVCGIFHDSRSWVYTGGYYLLGRNIPQYDRQYPAEPDAYNLFISQANIAPPEFTLKAKTNSYQVLIGDRLTTIPPYSIYERPGNCRLKDYSSYRSFPEVETILSNKSYD